AQLVRHALQRPERQLADVGIAGRFVGQRCHALLQQPQLFARDAQFLVVVDAHSTTSIIPFGTACRSVAKMRSTRRVKSSAATIFSSMKGNPSSSSFSASASWGKPGPIKSTQSTSLGSGRSVT